MSELFGNRKEMLKQMIKMLHQGADPDALKSRFSALLSEIGATDIALAEQELIAEGMPEDDVRRLCDVHLAVMREAVEKEGPGVGPGHPVYILLQEHAFIKGVAQELAAVVAALEEAAEKGGVGAELAQLEQLLDHLAEYNKHKVREENCLFPYLEKHGVTGPPSIMWMEHDQQREAVKAARAALSEQVSISFAEFKERILPHLRTLVAEVPSHFHKEENILFPTALNLFSAEEFKEVKASMDDLGYCAFTPAEAIGETVAVSARVGEGEISLPSGVLTVEQLEAMLNALPVDITFVGAGDEVRYFSMGADRIFPRTPAIIGRSVQQCHPQKSVHVVQQILDDFRAGRRDAAEFWIRMNERLVHIRYFPVRDKDGGYLGTLEMTQDITDLQEITGEKRLLD